MAADPERATSPNVGTKRHDAQWCERTDITVDADLARDAQLAADAEKPMSLWQGMKAYPKAVAWSIVISIATTMDGYDTGFLAALLGLVSYMQSLSLPDQFSFRALGGLSSIALGR